MATKTTTATGHPVECMCVRCLMADMDAHLAGRGLDPYAYAAEAIVEPERTRYATPGQACGRGVVRKVSEAQVRFIKRLLAERDTTTLVRLPGSEDVENMSLKGATDLIDRLLACPVLATAPRQDAPSEKALDFAMALVERKGLEVTREELAAKTRREVSQFIDMAKGLRDAPKAQAAREEEVTEGMYRDPSTGVILKVQRAVHGSGNLYAKRLVVEGGAGSFEYAAGAIRRIRPEWRMTLEEAKGFGALYGVCCVCSRTLTDEASIQAGIGPVCATKF